MLATRDFLGGCNELLVPDWGEGRTGREGDYQQREGRRAALRCEGSDVSSEVSFPGVASKVSQWIYRGGVE